MVVDDRADVEVPLGTLSTGSVSERVEESGLHAAMARQMTMTPVHLTMGWTIPEERAEQPT